MSIEKQKTVSVFFPFPFRFQDGTALNEKKWLISTGLWTYINIWIITVVAFSAVAELTKSNDHEA